jgi:hypothetical protein
MWHLSLYFLLSSRLLILLVHQLHLYFLPLFEDSLFLLYQCILSIHIQVGLSQINHTVKFTMVILLMQVHPMRQQLLYISYLNGHVWGQ